MKETDLVKLLLLNLGSHFPSTVRAWRNNTGSTVIKGQFIRFGVPGQADISGIVQGGRRLEIECKVEGGRQSPDQIAFEKMIISFGGIYILAYSWEDVLSALNSHISNV